MFALPYTLVMFLSAALLFLVQPIAGKVILPHLGGSPGVWNTCIVFFQALLLAGYAYAYLITKLPVRIQVLFHWMIISFGGAAAFFITPKLDWIPHDQDFPVVGLTLYLLALVGGPFFVLSATAPLFQRWFASTGAKSANDPYFLYAAGNAGSLLGLLAYPFVVEPRWSLSEQHHLWTSGYLLFAGLALLAGLVTLVTAHESPVAEQETEHTPLSLQQILTWMMLAALPSSLLVGLTTHITTDIAPIPLLWIVPLALYLMTFIIVFSWWPNVLRMIVGRAMPMTCVGLLIPLMMGLNKPMVVVLLIHLGVFAVAALLCHGELAASRPPKDRLALFYLAISLGGVLGGAFNTLLAPLLFSHIGTIEYPLAYCFVLLVRPKEKQPGLEKWSLRQFDIYWIAMQLNLVAILCGWVRIKYLNGVVATAEVRYILGILVYGLPAFFAYASARNPLRLALNMAVMVLGIALFDGVVQGYGHISRNFFGTLKIVDVEEETDNKKPMPYRLLFHGTTIHGTQLKSDVDGRNPTRYYHREGPVGRCLKQIPKAQRQRVAVVGLGCGTMAAYVEPGEEWTFYEIDPNVVRIASDENSFTYLAKAQSPVKIILGDARRRLEEAPDGSIDLLFLDAFSSDAIPVHLLTQEAFQLYSRKLSPRGVMLVHLSNRYLDLPPVVARTAGSLETPFQSRTYFDNQSTDSLPTAEKNRYQAEDRCAAIWSLLFRNLDDLGPLKLDGNAQPTQITPGPIWRDDFSNLIDVWNGQWRE